MQNLLIRMSVFVSWEMPRNIFVDENELIKSDDVDD